MTTRLHPESRRLAASEADRSALTRAERAKLKSQRDDMIIAPGKQSAARGYGRKMISSFFPSGLARLQARQTRRKKRGWVGGLFTPGGGLPPSSDYGEASGGLARGYYLAAPPGLRSRFASASCAR
jgi:hypothetical protein